MAETFSGSVKVSVSGTLASDIDLGSRAYALCYTTPSYTLTNGTAADQANQIWSDTRTLAASSTEDLDLAGGLTNAFGTTLTFTKIKSIIVKAAAGNTNNVLVGGASNAFVNWVSDATDKIVVRPGGCFALHTSDSTAYAVTASTGDLLRIGNSSSGTSVTYDIILIGCV